MERPASRNSGGIEAAAAALRRCGAALPILLTPGIAHAHASERGVILTLPTGRYILAAAAAVALTALLVAAGAAAAGAAPAAAAGAARGRRPSTAGSAAPRCWRWSRSASSGRAIRWRTCCRSPSGPCSGPAWRCQRCSLGNLWPAIEPWTAPATAAAPPARPAGLDRPRAPRRAGRRSPASSPSPGSSSSRWRRPTRRCSPAPCSATGSPSSPSPSSRARPGSPPARRSPSSSASSPASRRSGGSPDGRRLRLIAGLPGAQIAAMPPLAPGAAAFVALMLATVSFDGLSDTFWWLA